MYPCFVRATWRLSDFGITFMLPLSVPFKTRHAWERSHSLPMRGVNLVKTCWSGMGNRSTQGQGSYGYPRPRINSWGRWGGPWLAKRLKNSPPTANQCWPVEPADKQAGRSTLAYSSLSIGNCQAPSYRLAGKILKFSGISPRLFRQPHVKPV